MNSHDNRKGVLREVSYIKLFLPWMIFGKGQATIPDNATIIPPKKGGIVATKLLNAHGRYWGSFACYKRKAHVKQKFAHESPLAILSTLLKVTVLGKQQWEDIPGDGVPKSGPHSVVYMEDTGRDFCLMKREAVDFFRDYHPNSVWRGPGN